MPSSVASTEFEHLPVRRWSVLWSETWRILAAAITGALFLLAVATSGAPAFRKESGWWPVELLLGVTSLCLLPFRRRYPRVITTVLLAFAAVSAAAAPAAAISFISLCTRRRRTEIALGALGWIVGGVVFELSHPGMNPTTVAKISNAVTTGLSTAFCVAVGLAIGARRELVANLRRQVQAAAAQEYARVQQARLGERSRIAREMHDVLAHRISVVAMHSGALSYRTGLSEQEVQQTAGIIRDNAEIALTELREVLGVLRDHDAAGIEPPQPNLTAVRALVEDTPHEEGLIELVVRGDLEDVPESLSRSGFRVVQEALTNRRKHARGVPIVIEVHRDAALLRIRARNRVTGRGEGLPESGLGLIGLTERVELAGGSLHYGVDRSDCFVVDAMLPLHPRDEKV
ncbi:sensor histidine kinase [Calidifontibacter indicus]|uniref:sensor histidine kinase n=1 Tax=Calidifontibacter indicus TaxID=419650 RepID=UPI003D72EEF3